MARVSPMMLMRRFRCVDHCGTNYLIFDVLSKIRRRQTIAPPGRHRHSLAEDATLQNKVNVI